jgi:hypothetical protein
MVHDIVSLLKQEPRSEEGKRLEHLYAFTKS